mgnify:CR=1 FL=1
MTVLSRIQNNLDGATKFMAANKEKFSVLGGVIATGSLATIGAAIVISGPISIQLALASVTAGYMGVALTGLSIAAKKMYSNYELRNAGYKPEHKIGLLKLNKAEKDVKPKEIDEYPSLRM